MATQTNILSFDEAKRGSRAARARFGASNGAASRRPEGRRSRQGEALSSDPYGNRARLMDEAVSASRAATASHGFPTSRPASVPARARSGAASRSTAPAARGKGRADSAMRFGSGLERGAFAESRRASDDALGREARAAGSRRASNAERPRRGSENGAVDEAAPEERPSRFAAKRRARAKSKAGRAFAKQFGGADSDAAQAGPRAAVYKGEMGAKHRQAARMQNAGASQASLKRGTRSVSSESLVSSPRFIVGMALTVCLALSCVFLYPSAQQYYQSLRERDRLAAEYAAIVERNNAIEGDVAALKTEQGIQNKAHEQLGWVENGEQAGKVKGVDATEADDSAVHANVVAGSVDVPQTWYSPFLDALFGVE